MKSKAILGAFLLVFSWFAATTYGKLNSGNPKGTAAPATAVLWREPRDIASRNLFYGPGGEAHAPRGTFTFQEEDKSGSSPKFDVVDQNGVRWRVKMGPEARPETAASRLLWAAGYFANQDYFLQTLHVGNMQHLHRGSNLVVQGNTVYNVRLKRHLPDERKVGTWSWSKNPFTGTREWYGLRVMMAIMNNWDLKDSNTSIYRTRDDPAEERYVVSDLGGSFGPTGLNWSLKGKPGAYCESKWIKSISAEYVDFNVPSGLAKGYSLDFPELARRSKLTWLGRSIPRPDARWVGDLLARLSPQQIQDAFRAAGYSPAEVEELSATLEHRIAELEKL